jgi:uncharacterized membrane protein (DUF4010 family)
MTYEMLTILATSLGLGLLVGLQREYDEKKIAGIRTFTLVTLFGSLTALIGQQYGSVWVIAAGFLSLAGLIVGSNFLKSVADGPAAGVGQTTEVAMLIMYGIGAYLVVGDLTIGVAIGGMTALLLYLKSTLGGFVDKLDAKDLKAIMQFVAISLIVLPLLPDTAYGPYDVLNPYDIWLMVVLIVGLSLVGYFLYKWLGKNAGTVSNGILGGLISSTATTVTFSRRSTETENGGRLAAFIIFAASTIALVRVLVEVAVVAPRYFYVIAPPIILELIIMALLCVGLYWHNQNEETDELPEPDNPAQFKSALIFGLLYGFILLAVAAAKDYFGQSGLYIVSVISGLTDVDAITLSLSNTLNRGEIDSPTAWRLILIASLANLVFKGFMAAVLGTKKLAVYIAVLFGISIAAGLLIVWLWRPLW